MSRTISDMRNLGPAMQRMLGEVDIHNSDDLEAIGAVSAYVRLKFRFGRHISLMALYAMEAALQDCHWRDIDAPMKRTLRARLDDMNATLK